jgi:hypothetical protein
MVYTSEMENKSRGPTFRDFVTINGVINEKVLRKNQLLSYELYSWSKIHLITQSLPYKIILIWRRSPNFLLSDEGSWRVMDDH